MDRWIRFCPQILMGRRLPPTGAPNTFVGFPGRPLIPITPPIISMWISLLLQTQRLLPLPIRRPLVSLPFALRVVPVCRKMELLSSNYLDGIGDRLMFRLAYRNFGDHESVVGNFTVSSGGVAGIRWFELRNVTSGPVTVYQQSTYQPDTTWRWMGSAAMDGQGNLAIGFSASSSSIHPQLRYAGRLATDPLNTLAQGEAHLYDGAGSQTGSGNRWGDYSSLTIDPVDDATFWYTNEYYSSNTSYNWRTRIGSFKLATAPRLRRPPRQRLQRQHQPRRPPRQLLPLPLPRPPQPQPRRRHPQPPPGRLN